MFVKRLSSELQNLGEKHPVAFEMKISYYFELVSDGICRRDHN